MITTEIPPHVIPWTMYRKLVLTAQKFGGVGRRQMTRRECADGSLPSDLSGMARSRPCCLYGLAAYAGVLPGSADCRAMIDAEQFTYGAVKEVTAFNTIAWRASSWTRVTGPFFCGISILDIDATVKRLQIQLETGPDGRVPITSLFAALNIISGPGPKHNWWPRDLYDAIAAEADKAGGVGRSAMFERSNPKRPCCLYGLAYAAGLIEQRAIVFDAEDRCYTASGVRLLGFDHNNADSAHNWLGSTRDDVVDDTYAVRVRFPLDELLKAMKITVEPLPTV